MLPLHNCTALVFGCGHGPVTPGIDSLDCLTVGVNLAHKKHRGLSPMASFWIDGDVYESDPAFFDAHLCVCDQSVKSGKNAVRLIARGGALPRWPRPSKLVLRPNTAIVAAVWAISVGCTLVGLVGCGCEDDGRPRHQLNAMREARYEAAMAYQNELMFIDSLGDWMRFRRRANAGAHASDPVSMLKEFYA